MEPVRLKAGKEKPLLLFHPWIFSGAVEKMPHFQNGDILPVVSAKGDLLGHAYFNKQSGIIGRMVAFGNTPPKESIQNAIQNALRFRKSFINEGTTAYRLINGEGDFLPGFVADLYGTTLVIQIATLGMEKLKPFLLEVLERELNLTAIFEKSLLPSRKEEGLLPNEAVIKGVLPELVEVLENHLKFFVDPRGGQKTGFFLDQRKMREKVRSLSSGKKVLNCFGYTGGFTVAALAGGATQAVTVDISKEAIHLAEKNVLLNGFSLEKEDFCADDVFNFLREETLDFDLVILDPPAFAKKAKDVITACRGYKDINRIALQKMPKNSILITSSCSHFVDEKLFQQVLFQAASEAKRRVRIIGYHEMAEDHPVNIFHPEGEYLKSLVLYIE